MKDLVRSPDVIRALASDAIVRAIRDGLKQQILRRETTTIAVYSRMSAKTGVEALRIADMMRDLLAEYPSAHWLALADPRNQKESP